MLWYGELMIQLITTTMGYFVMLLNFQNEKLYNNQEMYPP